MRTRLRRALPALSVFLLNACVPVGRKSSRKGGNRPSARRALPHKEARRGGPDFMPPTWACAIRAIAPAPAEAAVCHRPLDDADMNDTRIRDATLEDVPFLRRMQWEALLASPRLVSVIGLENLRQIEDRVWAAWPDPDETAFVAEGTRGRLLGALILRVQERDGTRVVGHRLAMAVETKARRRGIGRQLLE
ncbi:MAG: hypothetical protein JO023_09060, partial [Chloroflexi bacterium]|nr:hypothetical protein [Chloroflexota bacterium]